MNRLINTINRLMIMMIGLFMIGCPIVDRTAIVNAKFFFINDSQDTIIITGGCGFSRQLVRSNDSVRIFPGDATIFYHDNERFDYNKKSNSPNTNNYNPIRSGGCQASYIPSGKCEPGFYKIENYKNRKELSENNFEFTYFFTEEKKQKADSCR